MKDNGKVGWFIFAAAVVITFALFTYFPGNSIHDAPAVNKIIGFSLLAMTVPMGLSLSHDWLSFSKENDKANTIWHIVIIAILGILGMCTLTLWY
jgi:hypothetical protein